MKNFRKDYVMLIAISSFVLLSGNIIAGEHPEHPTGAKKEHPEHSKKSAKPSSLTTEELAEAITNYVKKESANEGGFFVIEDKKTNKTLELTLVKVHKERLSMVAPETYFACADLKEKSGTIYDLDFFMKGPDKDHLTVTEVSVHKEDGKERYTWYEDNGIWKKQSIASKKKEGSSRREHPEHPKKKSHEHPEHPR